MRATRRALEIAGLSKRYGSVVALRHVDVRVGPGEIHGLLGPNGAGKTTLLRTLLGLAPPDSGDVRLLGRAAGTWMGPARGGVAGFVDAPQFYPYLSGRANLRLLACLDGAAADDRNVDDTLATVGLEGAKGAKVGGYSAGMRQRLGLASALLRAPRLLVLDEPTSSLDPSGARDLREHVRRLAADGASVLLSSHDMREVEELCSTLTILHRGRVVFSGTLEELRATLPAAVHRMSTSDDAGAQTVATAREDVRVTLAAEGTRLDVAADEGALDRYVIALGHANIAVRSLESDDRSLESLFFRLTTGEPPESNAPAAESPLPAADEPTRRAGGAMAVLRAEVAKLRAHAKVRATLGTCAIAPFVFVLALKLQSSLPEDTLFGRFAKASGLAVPLVVLGFAAAWALPAMTSIVAGDLFASEDRYGTWPTLLTRSRTRGELFAGKVLAALAFASVAVAVLALASIIAGTMVIGAQPLIGVSGTELPPADALRLVALAWATALPPTFGFAGLALLASVATRSSAAGVLLPVLLGLVMQLAALVNGPEVIRRVMLTTPLGAWHGLFADPPFYGPIFEGTAVSSAYFFVSILAAYVLFRRRDMGS